MTDGGRKEKYEREEAKGDENRGEEGKGIDGGKERKRKEL